MSALLALGLFIGLDNFRVATGLGALNLPRRRHWQFAVSFGVFEAVMPLVGLLVARPVVAMVAEYAEYLAPLLLAICGLLTLGGALWKTDARCVLDRRWLVLLLPLSLSFDNLLAGAALVSCGVPLIAAAVLIGCLSATLSLAGLSLGGVLCRWVPLPSCVVAGLVMLAASAMLLAEI